MMECELMMLQITTLLLHRDAQLTMLITRQNIDIANSSRCTAEATRLDSQSMKTIAILTMVFLPGTFVAVSQIYHLCSTDYSLSLQVTDVIDRFKCSLSSAAASSIGLRVRGNRWPVRTSGFISSLRFR